MTQFSIAQVLAAKKISRFMIKYMKTTKALLCFLEEIQLLIKDQNPHKELLICLGKKQAFPSKTVKDFASRIIHEIDWETVNNDHDWEILSIGE